MHRKLNLSKFLLAVVLCLECCGLRLPEGGYRPRWPNFELKKKEVSGDFKKLIDTKAIYISKSPNLHTDIVEGDTNYTFFRFFDGGQVFICSGLTHFPTNIDMNNLYSGKIGYCQVDDTLISLEYFNSIECGQYEILFGRVYNDSIAFSQLKSAFIWGIKPVRPITSFTHYKVKEPWMNLWARPDW